MKHTQKRSKGHEVLVASLLKTTTVSFLVLGILIVSTALPVQLLAKVWQGVITYQTGQGATMSNLSSTDAVLKEGPGHLAAPPETKDASTALIIGILFILAGFFFYVLYILRNEHPGRLRSSRRNAPH